MPRISPSLLRKARSIDRLLPPLLPVCRDLNSARNELRWLKEHAVGISPRIEQKWQRTLTRLCNQRARGKPLQYILGSEYFGDLEISCQPGVLIPRPETAAAITYLVKRLTTGEVPSMLTVLDLCTGTGCIPLLFRHEFNKSIGKGQKALVVLGVDISYKALRLANENRSKQNLEHCIGSLSSNSSAISFLQADVMADTPLNTKSNVSPLTDALQSKCKASEKPRWDILISNPPYISPSAFLRTTARSVRKFEPQLALVPKAKSNNVPDETQGDAFYPRLLAIAVEVEAKVVLFEVADMDQAMRVAKMLHNQRVWKDVEIWRDEPDPTSFDSIQASEAGSDGETTIRGTGNGRSVFARRGNAFSCLV